MKLGKKERKKKTTKQEKEIKLKLKPAYSWQRLKTGRDCSYTQEDHMCNRHGHRCKTLSKSAAWVRDLQYGSHKTQFA